MIRAGGRRAFLAAAGKAELHMIDAGRDSAISDNRRGETADCVESLLELLSVLFAVLFRIPAERT